jgi:hypothetical protein
MKTWSSHALQRTRRGCRSCNRGVPCAGSLSLVRLAYLRVSIFKQECRNTYDHNA